MHSHEQSLRGFDFADLYEAMTSRAWDGAVFVEVGASLGCSAVYLASCIQRSKKTIRLYAVNPWDGQPHMPRIEREDSFQHFLAHVRRARVEEVLYPLRMASEQAAELFENGTLDFVFLNANHEREMVLRDLAAWFPKVKQRGVLGGHPYLHPQFRGVRRAADEFFREQELPLQILGTSFLAIKLSQRWLRASQRLYRRRAA